MPRVRPNRDDQQEAGEVDQVRFKGGEGCTGMVVVCDDGNAAKIDDYRCHQ